MKDCMDSNLVDVCYLISSSSNDSIPEGTRERLVST